MTETTGSPEGFSVEVSVVHRDDARSLIEALEDNGVPALSIELVEPGSGTDPQKKAGRVFGDVGRSVLLAATLGVVIGAGLGLLVSTVTVVEPMFGAIAGAVFGAFTGVAAGGIRVAKYASPGWRDASDAESPRRVRVVVHHQEREVIETASEVMRIHGHQPEAGDH